MLLSDAPKKPARSTLESVPDRVSRFLRGLAHNAQIRAALAVQGYDDADHQEGWNLFHDVNGYSPGKAPVLDRTAGLAMAELDRLDADLIDKIDATLGHRFPVQRDTLLAGLGAGEKAVAVANVKTILERLATLSASNDPHDTAANQRLAKVKLDQGERNRLAELVKNAEGFEAQSGAGIDNDTTRWTRLEPAHLALWGWYDEWSRAANRAITRRDWLVTLGLAKRRDTRADSPESPIGDTPNP